MALPEAVIADSHDPFAIAEDFGGLGGVAICLDPAMDGIQVN